MLNFELPVVKQKARVSEPRMMVLFASPKVGKTSLVSQLPNSLIIDLEDGASYYENTSINLREELTKHNSQSKAEGKSAVSRGRFLLMLAEHIKKANEQKGSPVYDFIILDTITELEEIAKEVALSLYKNTPIFPWAYKQ